MLNVYVHLVVRGLPPGALEDESVLERLWGELLAAAFGGGRDAFGVTLSQFAFSDRTAGHRQAQRVKRALVALGFRRAEVSVDETTREGWQDDVTLLVASIRDYLTVAPRRLVDR